MFFIQHYQPTIRRKDEPHREGGNLNALVAYEPL